MDYMHISDTHGFFQDSRIPRGEIDEGPSMEELINSMRKHLLSPQDGDSVYECQNGVESKDSTPFLSEETRRKGSPISNGFFLRDSCSDYDSPVEHKQLANGQADGLRKLPNGHDPGLIVQDSSDQDYIDISKDHPTLASPIYKDLRQKYPIAFRRRKYSTSSETSSVTASPRRSRPSSRCSNFSVEFSDSSASIPLSNGTGKGILKTNRASKSTLQRSDSNVSVADRLRKNSETLKQMLADDHSPFKTRRSRSQEKSHDHVEPSHDLLENGGTLTKRFTSLEDLQSKISEKYNELQKKAKPNGGSSTDISPRSIDNDRPTRQKVMPHNGGQRVSSPESPHDSAVDMDTVSIQSSPSTDTNGCWTNGVKAPPTFQHNSQGFGNDSRDLHLPGHEYFQRKFSELSGTTIENGFHGMEPQQKDSDVDSGIAQAYNHDTNGRKDSTSSSSNGIATSSNDIASSSNDIASSSNDIEQEREGKTDAAPRLNTLKSMILARQARQARDGFKQKHQVAAPMPTKPGPLKADHSIQPTKPKAEKSKEDLEVEQWYRQGARPKNYSNSSSSDDKDNYSQPIKRPKSSQEKHRRRTPSPRVHFEDDVNRTNYEQEQLQLNGYTDLPGTRREIVPRYNTPQERTILNGGDTQNGPIYDSVPLSSEPFYDVYEAPTSKNRHHHDATLGRTRSRSSTPNMQMNGHNGVEAYAVVDVAGNMQVIGSDSNLVNGESVSKKKSKGRSSKSSRTKGSYKPCEDSEVVQSPRKPRPPSRGSVQSSPPSENGNGSSSHDRPPSRGSVTSSRPPSRMSEKSNRPPSRSSNTSEKPSRRSRKQSLNQNGSYLDEQKSDQRSRSRSQNRTPSSYEEVNVSNRSGPQMTTDNMVPTNQEEPVYYIYDKIGSESVAALDAKYREACEPYITTTFYDEGDGSGPYATVRFHDDFDIKDTSSQTMTSRVPPPKPRRRGSHNTSKNGDKSTNQDAGIYETVDLSSGLPDASIEDDIDPYATANCHSNPVLEEVKAFPEEQEVSQYAPNSSRQGRRTPDIPENSVDAEYAQVDFSKKRRKKTLSQAGQNSDLAASNPCIASDPDEGITETGWAPEIPSRGYESDLEKYRDLSGSKSSLLDRMSSFRNSAKKKFSRLRKAISLDRIDKVGKEEGKIPHPPKIKKSPSLKSLTLPFKRKVKEDPSMRYAEDGKLHDTTLEKNRRKRPSSAPMGRRRGSSASLDSVDSPSHFRPIGKLISLNSDYTQVIELVKPPHGPFGFYIARGNARYNHGIFVSRMSDGHPEKFFSGLLGLGDEIIDINGIPVRNLTLDQVYDLMAERDKLVLKTLPFLARRDS